MKALLYATLVLGLVAGSVQAGTILVVTDCEVPGGAGTDHRDDNLVAFLQGLGHTVDTYGMNKTMRGDFDATDQTHADGADLIIVSRRTGSGDYNKPTQWNSIATPLIQCSGYLTRSSRWKWTAGGSGDATRTETDLVIDAAHTGHAFLSGLTGPVGLFDWSTVPAGNNQAPKGVYLPNKDGSSDFDDEATVIGTFDGRDMLADLPAGPTMSNGDVLGARRAFLSHWGYDGWLDFLPYGSDTGEDRDANWGDFITDDHKTVLTNMVNTLIPEPATLTLLVVGAAATLIRRKK